MEESIDRDRVQALVRMLKDSEASELSVSDGETTITVKRATVASPSTGPSAEDATDVSVEAVETAEDLVEVQARLVGLFHAGSRPGEEPLVHEGDSVEEGQTIGTIEALRNFTEVISPVAGTIEKVLAEDGTAVQYGDVLFMIRP